VRHPTSSHVRFCGNQPKESGVIRKPLPVPSHRLRSPAAAVRLRACGVSPTLAGAILRVCPRLRLELAQRHANALKNANRKFGSVRTARRRSASFPYASRVTAKVDSTDVQDEYQFYDRAFFFASTANAMPLKACCVAAAPRTLQSRRTRAASTWRTFRDNAAGVNGFSRNAAASCSSPC